MDNTPKEGLKRRVTPFRLIVSSLILLVVMTGYVFLYTGQVAAVEVISGSMEPTIMTGDRILVKRFIDGTPQRGDIVVLDSPGDNGPDLVKRVVGVPGDEIQMKRRILYINGDPDTGTDDQPFIHAETPNFALTLPPEYYFVLGDNRNVSYDSTEFGPIHRSRINGLAWIRYAPIDRSGSLD